MSALLSETVLRADHLWPGDRFKRGGRTLQALTVAVTPGEPVIVTARDLDAASATVALQFPADASELLRILP